MMGKEYESPYTADVPDSQNGFLNDRETDLEDIDYDTLLISKAAIGAERYLDGQQIDEEYKEIRDRNVAALSTKKVNRNISKLNEKTQGAFDLIGEEIELGYNDNARISEYLERHLDHVLNGEHGQDTAVRFYQVPAPEQWEREDSREFMEQLGQSAQTILDSDWIKMPHLLLESREPETVFGEPGDARQVASVYNEHDMDELPVGFLVDFDRSENPREMADILPDGSIHKVRGEALASENQDLPEPSLPSATLKQPYEASNPYTY